MNQTNLTIIKANIESQLRSEYIAPIVLSASPGVGKTSAIRKMTKDNGWGMINVSCGTLVPEFLSGIPDFKTVTNMDQYSTVGATGSQSTQWSVPELIEVANNLASAEGSNGAVILLDDLHELNSATSSYMLEFLLERKLGQYLLHPNVAIVSTMNDSDEANFTGMSSAIRNRLAILNIEFDFDTWYNAYGKKYHFYIASFLKTHASYVQEDESTQIEGFATPRSYDFMSTTFETLPREFVKDNSTKLAAQYVSKAAANELTKHIAYIEAIDFSAKIKAKEDINIKDLKPIDQILYAYIINYVETMEDAKYVMKLIDANISSSNFIGFIVGELYTKFLSKEDGKYLSNGLIALLEKLLEHPMKEEDYHGKLTKKDQETYDEMSFAEHAKLYSLASEFIH